MNILMLLKKEFWKQREVNFKLKKTGYKRLKGKDHSVQDRLNHKEIYCISDNWIKWAKKYLSRSNRRKENSKIKNKMQVL